MDDDRILERERQQIQQIRELEFEELQIEEVDELNDSSDDERNLTYAPRGAHPFDELTFNPALASLHTYLGEIDDTHHRLTFLDGGAILKLPLFYLEGVVLFPESVLPLRVIETSFLASVQRALEQSEAPYTIGVVHVYRDSGDGRVRFATTGTTAEIRQYRQLEDGSLNVVTRGQQRFRLIRRWTDPFGAPCGEVQIIQEDLPLRTPRDAFGKLGPLSNLQRHNHSHMPPSSTSSLRYVDADVESKGDSEESFEDTLSPTERRMHNSLIGASYDFDWMDETSSDDDKTACATNIPSSRSHHNESHGSLPSGHANAAEDFGLGIGEDSFRKRKSHRGEGSRSYHVRANLSQFRVVPRAYLPFWVYRMYDSYYLARRAAGMWKQIVGVPDMEALVAKPQLLSFYIASKIPLSAASRQELLDIDGVSYRLRREIEMLESFDRVQCKNCQTVIARRSDMLVMSSEGPLGAYVNPNGCVHEIMTFYDVTSIALLGRSVEEYSWFPGYAWTIANCSTCEDHMGWLFNATNKKLKPQSFWAVRSSQVADDVN